MRGALGDPRLRPWLGLGLVVIALGLATLAVDLAQSWFGVSNASAMYLLAVVAVAGLFGIWAGVGAAIAAFLLYDFLFVSPQLTLTVADPAEWLELVLLLVVGVVVGELAGLLRVRADVAIRREHEALALFAVSRALATAPDARAALPIVVGIAASGARMDRVWVTLDGHDDRVVADTGRAPGTFPPSHAVLQKSPGASVGAWIRVHDRRPALPRSRGVTRQAAYRARIEAGGDQLGSLWATRDRALGDPGESETRLVASTADQIGSALERDRYAAQATDAEVARRSDTLKSALLDSVSHDLRTPLASIRAAAGSLMDSQMTWDDDSRQATAAAIDREADRLNRLVTDLLDLSRIEAGSLHPALHVFVLEDLVSAVVARLGQRLDRRTVAIELPPDLPPVLVDDVHLDQVLTNLLENVVGYTPPETHVWIRGHADGSTVVLSLEDDGPGVPPEALAHLFEKFYRVTGRREGSRRGTGIGLSVARGLVQAMGGSIIAAARPGGGLAFELRLISAPPPTVSATREEPSLEDAGDPATVRSPVMLPEASVLGADR